ncbi:MAG TPA: hypothetical protein VHY09_04820 [Candidatus Methylacidiphilales bacterium]|nr:hypothetical protein [Candidatus Methylacidiphilales bacterium]
MKTLNLYRILACAAIIAGFSFSSSALADTVVTTHEAWSHDDHGYWDGHHGYHAFIMHENHHGYWRENPDGTRIFVNID